MEEKDYKLYIPSNVKTRLEFFKGYGVKELIITIIVVIALFPISFIVYKIKGSYLIPIVIEFVGIAGTIIAVTKDDNNLCVVDLIRFMFKFANTQKEYKYKYYNKWRDWWVKF